MKLSEFVKMLILEAQGKGIPHIHCDLCVIPTYNPEEKWTIRVVECNEKDSHLSRIKFDINL